MAFVVQRNKHVSYQSTLTVSQSPCSQDIRSYKRFLQFSGVGRELELDFGEARQFFGNDYLPIISIVLGIEQKRVITLFFVPRDVSGHKRESKEVLTAETGISTLVRIDVLLVYSHFVQG